MSASAANANCIRYFEQQAIFVGKPKSEEDAAQKWRSGLRNLRLKFEITRPSVISLELYSNFLWSIKPKRVELKHRHHRQGYVRKGWYISSFDSTRDRHGQFFLSDEGNLMVAINNCSLPLTPLEL